jgi:hypothetical protein
LPKLRSLTLRGAVTADVIATLRRARWWPQLDRLAVVATNPMWGGGRDRQRDLVPEGWFALVESHVDPVVADGWEIAFGPNDTCRVALRGFCPQGSLEQLEEIVFDIGPIASIELVPSAYYSPARVDAARLAALVSCPVFCAGD